MENNRNWAGIAAVVLAGLALFVALAGRVGPNFDFSAHVWSGASDGQALPGAYRLEKDPQGNVIVLPTVVPPVAPAVPVVPAPVAPVGPVAPIKPGAPAGPVKGSGFFAHPDYGP